MNKKLKNIKILVWDVDGTLYQSIPEYFSAMEKKQLELLSRVKRISLLKAKDLFLKKKKIYKSATKTLSKLGCGEIADVARKIDIGGRRGLIKKDKALLEMLKALTGLRHLILTNRAIKGTIEILEALGLPRVGVFERIFSTAEDFGTVKPDPVVFKKILEYTKLPASQHLMIGDRVEVDLVPAKKLGMKTCLVWSKSNDSSVDVSVSTVYNIVTILA